MLSDLLFRLRALFRGSSMEAKLDSELRFHFEHEVAKYIGSGLSPEEARRRARLAFGSFDQVHEDCREAGGVNLLETIFQDIRYALRILRRTSVITAVAIFSLALGIGANTAIFTLIDAVLLRSLPLRDPQQLVQLRIHNRVAGEHDTVFTNPLWEQVRGRQDIFSGAVAWSDSQFDLAKGGAVQNVNGVFASGDYFNVLGVQPVLGRSLTPADDQRGCPGVAMLSYGFWQEHFGGDPSVIGGTLSLDKHNFEIIGVARPGAFMAPALASPRSPGFSAVSHYFLQP
ncbi:MAG TPA: ABC transporter permease [Candidatus Acidoferrum sp.]|nr:ABC transporter permease [Candidatus Acidoferrum sp.]